MQRVMAATTLEKPGAYREVNKLPCANSGGAVPTRKERVMTRSPLLAITLVAILGVSLALVPMLIELAHVLGGALDGIVPQS